MRPAAWGARMPLRRVQARFSFLPEVKKVIRSVTMPQCEEVVRHARTLENAREIKAYLREELKKIAPEFVSH